MPTKTVDTAGPYVLQPEEGERINNLRLRMLATGALTGDTLMAVECVNPGPGGPLEHIHASHDEFYYVLQGRYRFKIGEDEHDGGPGTFAYVPRNTSHTFASLGPEEGKLLTFSLPGLDGFLRCMSERIAAGAGDQEMTGFFREFDSEVTGSHLI